MEVVIENGEVRSAHTLELLGHSFMVDGVRYYIPLNK